MATAVSCISVVKTGGKVYVNWSDLVQNEFASVAQAHEYIGSPIAADIGTDDGIRELLRRIAIAKFLRVSPDGSNTAVMEGKTLTFDLDVAANFVRLTNT